MAWFSRSWFRCLSLGGLGAIAACSETETRPPFPPTLEGGEQIYIAPVSPAGTTDPSDAGATSDTPDAGASDAASFGGTGGLGGSSGLGGAPDGGLGGAITLDTGGAAFGGAGGMGGGGAP